MNSLASSHVRACAAPALPRVDRPISSREHVDEFIAIVRRGDLRSFMQYVHSHELKARDLADIANAASKSINRREIWIPNVMIATGIVHGKPIDRIQISFRVDSVKRIMSVSSDPSIIPLVAGPRKDSHSTLPAVLPEDPSVLFRQIGRLVSLPRIPSPPPLTFR